MSEQPTTPPLDLEEPASVTAARRYLRGEIDYAALKKVEATADPLERAAWLVKQQTNTAVELIESRRRIAVLEADLAAARAALADQRAWMDRPEWATQAALAHAHGYRVDSAVIEEGRALRTRVDAALAARP